MDNFGEILNPIQDPKAKPRAYLGDSFAVSTPLNEWFAVIKAKNSEQIRPNSKHPKNVLFLC